MNFKILGLVVSGLIVGPLTANAETVIDTSTFCSTCVSGYDELGLVTNSSPAANYEVAQTFTVVNTGSLTAITLFGTGALNAGYDGAFTAYIVPVVSGVPDSNLSQSLGSVSGTLTSANGALMNLSGFSVPVMSGEQLAIVLASPIVPGIVENPVFAYYTPGSPAGFVAYTGGNLFRAVDSTSEAPPTNWVEQSSGASLGFATYVACSTASCVPSATGVFIGAPEIDGSSTVSALTLLLGGLLALRGRRPMKLGSAAA
jgi:hypothetical protein